MQRANPNQFCPVHGSFRPLRQRIPVRKAGIAATGVTGAVTIGGIKSGTCFFANFKPRNVNVTQKMRELAGALRAESTDGCYTKWPEIQKSLNASADELTKAAILCEKDSQCGR